MVRNIYIVMNVKRGANRGLIGGQGEVSNNFPRSPLGAVHIYHHFHLGAIQNSLHFHL